MCSRITEITLILHFQQVGSGTFGVVKLAKHRDTERVVAIKCLKKVDIRKNRQINSVLNECRSNQAMNHPFVNELLGRLRVCCLYSHTLQHTTIKRQARYRTPDIFTSL